MRQNQHQNRSLLSFDDLEQRAHGDPRFAISARRRHGELRRRHDRAPATYAAIRAFAAAGAGAAYGESVPWSELLTAAKARCEQLRRGFPLGYRAVSPLRIELSDQGRSLELDLRSEPHAAKAGAAHIAAHSRAVHDWLGRRFGDDSFIAGGHFELRDRDTRTAKLWIALSRLEASQLSVRDAMRYLRTKNGLRFLWARREEILATLTSGPLKARRDADVASTI